ncbi:hypothetical protein SDC9_149188 [bioreactor metagenome]|uniref:Uncharacterized protein n=1 Tax=bioreactor metagenome TaxID=1076179 RepID=A0A645EIX7_9ZZZZ
MHRRGKALEPQRRVQFDDLDPVEVIEQRGMRSETEVDQPAPLVTGAFGERLNQRAVLGETVDLPDDVVAEPQTIEDAVEPPDARARPVVALHEPRLGVTAR